MTENILYLSARYTVSIRIEDRSSGTNGQWAYITAFATAENDARRLTASVSIFCGDRERLAELREEAARGALARLCCQVEALEALE